ncbi:transposase family protein [Streptomyces sp. SJL17-4]|uniref:transposase family protein n=1 Tax=Streptomyces sp. SJL17-4 TaxID=2967224 RepID=UPI0030D0EB52
MAGVITASEPSWIAPFAGLNPHNFGKLVTVLRREGADADREGRPWSLPLEDRALLVAAYWRTNLTMRQLAPLFGVSKSAADRIIDHLGPMLALQPRKRFAKDTVLIVDGTLVPTRDHAIAERSKNYLKTWKILRDCRLKGDGVHHAMLGIARMHNLALAG